jgi:hypothetical protein
MYGLLAIIADVIPHPHIRHILTVSRQRTGEVMRAERKVTLNVKRYPCRFLSGLAAEVVITPACGHHHSRNHQYIVFHIRSV